MLNLVELNLNIAWYPDQSRSDKCLSETVQVSISVMGQAKLASWSGQYFTKGCKDDIVPDKVSSLYAQCKQKQKCNTKLALQSKNKPGDRMISSSWCDVFLSSKWHILNYSHFTPLNETHTVKGFSWEIFKDLWQFNHEV